MFIVIDGGALHCLGGLHNSSQIKIKVPLLESISGVQENVSFLVPGDTSHLEAIRCFGREDVVVDRVQEVEEVDICVGSL